MNKKKMENNNWVSFLDGNGLQQTTNSSKKTDKKENQNERNKTT